MTKIVRRLLTHSLLNWCIFIDIWNIAALFGVKILSTRFIHLQFVTLLPEAILLLINLT